MNHEAKPPVPETSESGTQCGCAVREADFPEFVLDLLRAIRELIESRGDRLEPLVETYNAGWPDGRVVGGVRRERADGPITLSFATGEPDVSVPDWEHLGAAALVMLDPCARAVARQKGHAPQAADVRKAAQAAAVRKERGCAEGGAT